jgi:hypothetical protein
MVVTTKFKNGLAIGFLLRLCIDMYHSNQVFMQRQQARLQQTGPGHKNYVNQTLGNFTTSFTDPGWEEDQVVKLRHQLDKDLKKAENLLSDTEFKLKQTLA